MGAERRWGSEPARGRFHGARFHEARLGGARFPGRRGKGAAVVLAVLVAVLAATLVRVRADLGEARAAADDREAALRAAGAHAVSLLSVDYRTIDQDMRRILATSTAQARDGYIKNAAPLKRTTVGSRVIQEGALRSAGLVSMSAARDSAEVLVVADGVIRWAGGKAAPQERYYRWDMRLTKIGNSWLVAKAEQVS